MSASPLRRPTRYVRMLKKGTIELVCYLMLTAKLHFVADFVSTLHPLQSMIATFALPMKKGNCSDDLYISGG